MTHEHKTIHNVRWFIDAGDGRTFLRALYDNREIVVPSPKLVLLNANLLIVNGLDPDDYDEGEVVLYPGDSPFTFDKHARIIESTQLALEVVAMHAAFNASPRPLDDPRFEVVGGR